MDGFEKKNEGEKNETFNKFIRPRTRGINHADWPRLTVVQLNDEWVIHLHQDVSLHLSPDTIAY